MLIRNLTREDLPVIVGMTNAGFKGDEIFDWLYPYQDKFPEDLRRSHQLRLQARLVGKGSHGFVAETEASDPDWTGRPEVVGYTFWLRTGQDETAKVWQSGSLLNALMLGIGIERYLLSWEQSYESYVYNRACDSTRIMEYEKTRNYGFYSLLDPRWHLRAIVVSPQHQRRGIGQMLLGHGQELARRENLPITLEASVKGRALYANSGFKVVDETEITEGLHCVSMVWEPEKSQGRWLEDVGNGKANVMRRLHPAAEQ
ncbi:acyl-CoA N-acyltransferase [Lophiostoma macrostomum CBS 122681]|uniref:Acyl-CoA N-acyltransferase n=1 Tax=Lophiostoma macrostomum CBS 122681 TaxID=1314788 RepID=A0A6A6SWZ5_9PLEO|nr:acyl-CoA N-acyltransferase [Lophiostoma macrostomum CBS 122681]